MARDECIDINKTIPIYHLYENIRHCNTWFIENDTVLNSDKWHLMNVLISPTQIQSILYITTNNITIVIH